MQLPNKEGPSVSKPSAIWEKDGFVLRPFAAGEGEKYYLDCFSHPDPEAARLTGSPARFPRADVIAHYESAAEDPDRFDFILVAPGGQFVGETVLNEIDWPARCANFRIALFSSACRNRGLGSWAAACTRDFAFGVLGLHRLELDVFSFNPRARRVYEKLGFRVEGVRRQAIRDGSGWGDDILMAMLEQEWRQLPGSKGQT